MSPEVLVLQGGLVFCRVGACAMLMPGLSSARVPARVRLFLALALAVALTPLVGPRVAVALGSADPGASVLLVVTETLAGAAIGTLARLFFAAIETAAVALSYAMGLSSAFAPPIEADQSLPPLASLVTLVATMLFFAGGFHLEVLGYLVRSYVWLPPGHALDAGTLLARAADTLADASTLALRIAAPLLLVSLVVNAAFGLLNRIVPQVPVYFLAVPFSIAAGLSVLQVADRPMLQAFTAGFDAWLAAQ